MEYCFAVSNRDLAAERQVLYSFGDEKNPGASIRFDSPFEEQVFNRLVEEGYDVNTQIGVGGYSIDLAIKHDNHYILGIECDGRLYHSSASARERDYHRQKYLESRGWKIHRIWSTKWWKNPESEIRKITELADALIDEYEAAKERKKCVTGDEKANDYTETSSKEKAVNQEKKYKTNKKTATNKIELEFGAARTPYAFQENENTEPAITKPKRCEECKFYRNESCAGLRICEDYTPVPLAK